MEMFLDVSLQLNGESVRQVFSFLLKFGINIFLSKEKEQRLFWIRGIVLMEDESGA